mmetsp:Transcript_25769/g.28656  ORF Transcript_25769/g.28656 Transcript_25769/m.28656 type:complete len:119 (-) Transcript_25769:71-427(-)
MSILITRNHRKGLSIHQLLCTPINRSTKTKQRAIVQKKRKMKTAMKQYVMRFRAKGPIEEQNDSDARRLQTLKSLQPKGPFQLDFVSLTRNYSPYYYKREQYCKETFIVLEFGPASGP